MMRRSEKSKSKVRAYIEWRDKTALPIKLREQNGRCAVCDIHYSKTIFDLDHIIPRSSAPDKIMDIDNVRLVCRGCHNEKHFGVRVV